MIKEFTISDKKSIERVVVAACGYIYKRGENNELKVLLIQRSEKDHWKLAFETPRGKCDKGKNEDVYKCALREIKEETGLDVIIEKYLGKYFYLAEGGKRKTICYNFLCKMKDPNQKVKLSHEHKTYKWITQVGEAELLLHPDQMKFIEMILSTENPIKSRPENDFTKNNKIEEYLKIIQ